MAEKKGVSPRDPIALEQRPVPGDTSRQRITVPQRRHAEGSVFTAYTPIPGNGYGRREPGIHGLIPMEEGLVFAEDLTHRDPHQPKPSTERPRQGGGQENQIPDKPVIPAGGGNLEDPGLFNYYSGRLDVVEGGDEGYDGS